MGVVIMLAGTGIAFFFGKPYMQPSAPLLAGILLGFWSDAPEPRYALLVSPPFSIGITWGYYLFMPHPTSSPWSC
jgi:general nucleoside transport system permease protein